MKRFFHTSLLTTTSILSAALLALSTPSYAQEERQIPEIVVAGEEDEAVEVDFNALNIDFSEQMRLFIQKMARYARRYNRDFIVLVNDGNNLLQTVVDPDLLTQAPSSVYIQSLDGIIQPNLSYGFEKFGKATGTKEQELMMGDLKIASDAGLKIFTLDHVSKVKDVQKAYKFSRKNGFIPYAAPGVGFLNNRFPDWPKRPTQENQHNITNINQVRNYIMVNDSSRFGTRDEFAMKMHNTNYDMIITDVFHHRYQAFTKHNIETMQYKKLGARRPVLALMDVGFADAGRYYWQDEWTIGNPNFLMEQVPGSTDKFMTKYWHPSWQQVIFGNNNSYLYGILDLGFDGVVIDGAYAEELFSNPDGE